MDVPISSLGNPIGGKNGLHEAMCKIPGNGPLRVSSRIFAGTHTSLTWVAMTKPADRILYAEPRPDGRTPYWTMRTIWAAAEGKPAVMVAIEDLNILDAVVWFGGPKNVEPTVRRVAARARYLQRRPRLSDHHDQIGRRARWRPSRREGLSAGRADHCGGRDRRLSAAGWRGGLKMG